MPAEPLCVLRLEGRAALPCLERVHDLVDELWRRVPDVEPTDRHRFETAVIEVAGNIVEHGGPEVRLELSLTAWVDRVEARFRDTGEAVDVEAAAAHVPDAQDEAGRGIALARAAADAVRYERTERTNRWYVLKRRSAPV